MIRNIAIFSSALLFVASCASNQGYQTTQTFAPAQFNVDDVFVNVVDGVENSKRIRTLMKNAGKNTARVYNQTMRTANASYPLEIEVNSINYRNPNSNAVSGDRTYIKYTATLRVAETGETYRTLPVTYYHISTGSLDSDAAKQDAEKNMIRLSIKNAFAGLYGMKTVPQSVTTYFNTSDVFSTREQTPKLVAPVSRPTPAPAVSQPSVTPAPVASAPEVIIAPDEPITATTTTDDGLTVIECVVC